MTDHSLINPNQVRAFNIPLHDNPFDAEILGIEADKAFIPFTSKRGVISFDLWVPMEWEDQNLIVILITGYQWDPMNAELGSRKRYKEEVKTKDI